MIIYSRDVELRREVIERLKRIVGDEDVITDEAELVCYSFDASNYRQIPEVVVFPESTEEVSEILKLANEEKIPVTPRGGGTSISGGAVPIKKGIVMAFTKMNRVLEFDEDNLVVTVEPGITLNELNGFLRKKGYVFPVDPASGEAATIGGMLGENSSGTHSPKYGKTSESVLGLEVVLANGEVIHTGSKKCYKSVSGYDLTRLFIGSEGTLGVITKAYLKVVKPPEYYSVLTAAFKDVVEAGRGIVSVVKSGIPVSALEFMDEYTIKVVKEFTGLPLPEEAAAMVLVECQGGREEVDRYLNQAAELLKREGAFEISVSKSVEEAEKLWYARKAAFGAISRKKPTPVQEDPSVPISKLPEYIKRLNEIAKKYDLTLISFGHAGEGNLHPTIMTDERNEEEMERVEKAVGEMLKAAIELEGTLTGEHGIGLAKAKYVNFEREREMKWMRKIKEVFDPNNILNPGKMGFD